MSKSEIWSLKLWFTALKELNKCFVYSKTCKYDNWLYFIGSIGFIGFQNSWIRKTSFDLCIRKYWFLKASHKEITKWKASRICIHTEERPHALRPLNPSFSQIVDRWSWSSITIVNSRSLPQIVIFNDHGSFKPINDHDRKLKKRRSRIVVVANDRRSSDRLRHRRPQIVSWWHRGLRKK